MNAGSVAKNFPIVCVGGSARGLDAYTRLLKNLPGDMGVAFVSPDTPGFRSSQDQTATHIFVFIKNEQNTIN